MSYRVIVLSEERSRFSDGGQMLPANEVPDDGLCRAIIGCEESDKITAVVSYPELIVLALHDMCDTDFRIWCCGEVSNIYTNQIRESVPRDFASMKADKRDDLIIFCLTPHAINTPAFWPIFAGDYGCRYFAFSDQTSNNFVQFEQTMAALHSEIAANSAVALSLWRQIRQTCLTRSGIRDICRETIACVLPDGPHFNEVAFHSINRSLNEITASVSQIAEKYSVEYSIVNNLGNEYKQLL